MFDSADDFVQEFFGRKKNPGTFRIATVAGLFPDGEAKLRFDGETQPSGKRYGRLACYTPETGDRVLTAGIGNTNIILGKIKY